MGALRPDLCPSRRPLCEEERVRGGRGLLRRGGRREEGARRQLLLLPAQLRQVRDLENWRLWLIKGI